MTWWSNWKLVPLVRLLLGRALPIVLNGMSAPAGTAAAASNRTITAAPLFSATQVVRSELVEK
jgi:hypothetical protein